MGISHSHSVDWHTLFSEDWQKGWMHSGIVELTDKRFAFEAPGGGALLFLDPRTGKIERVEIPVAAAHGIFSVLNGNEESLWICDPGAEPPGQVIKISLLGEVIDSIQQPIRSSDEVGKWRPTAMTITKDGVKWIADGYGLSLLHRISPTGEICTFDGSSSGRPFDCPHGVTTLERNGETLIVVADRANKRLVYLDSEGTHVRNLEGDLLTSPSSLVSRDGVLYVTDLFSTIIKVDRDNNLRAVIPSDLKNGNEGWPNTLNNGEVVGPTLTTGEMNSPHGISLSKTGEIIFTDWCLGGRVVKLS